MLLILILRTLLILRNILSSNVQVREGGGSVIIAALQFYDKRLPCDAGEALCVSDACLFVLARAPDGTALMSSAL